MNANNLHDSKIDKSIARYRRIQLVVVVIGFSVVLMLILALPITIFLFPFSLLYDAALFFVGLIYLYVIVPWCNKIGMNVLMAGRCPRCKHASSINSLAEEKKCQNCGFPDAIPKNHKTNPPAS